MAGYHPNPYPNPERDPTSYDGLYWRARPLPSRAPDMVGHTHYCPDGTEVLARSQYLPGVDRTLDRWWVGGEPAGATARVGGNATPPDFGWVDAAHASPEAA